MRSMVQLSDSAICISAQVVGVVSSVSDYMWG